MKHFLFWCGGFALKSHCKLVIFCIWYKWQGFGSGGQTAGVASVRRCLVMDTVSARQFQPDPQTGPPLATAEPISKVGGRIHCSERAKP